MLSGETANGEFPVEAVTTMARIAHEADLALTLNPSHEKIARMRQNAIRRDQFWNADAIAQAACRTAEAVNARQIVCFTRHGLNASLIARYRPTVPITAITLTEMAKHRCAIIWGVDALMSIEPVSTDDLDRMVDDTLLSNGLADEGDIVVILGGFPLAMQRRANMIKPHKVGDRTEGD
jgi:pyruvate kinase